MAVDMIKILSGMRIENFKKVIFMLSKARLKNWKKLKIKALKFITDLLNCILDLQIWGSGRRHVPQITNWIC